MNEQVLEALRNMAWERAMGELRAMLGTSFPPKNISRYDDIKMHDIRYQAKFDLVENFIKEMEDNYL